MRGTLTEKILSRHLLEGQLRAGEEIGIRIDQTLTQDATGTMAALQFEALGVARARTELSVSYIDHNTMQIGYENADDHRYLRSFASRYGVWFSPAGNGICHQIHLQRFGRPGRTLIGSDSHTPTAGALGMFAVAWAAWMWRWPWPANPSTSSPRASSASGSAASCRAASRPRT